MSDITVRPAVESDDLGVLFPEAQGRHLNRDQVFLAVDQVDGRERLLGGSILWHAGHDIAYVGATRFADSERKPWVVRALWRAVIAWCKAEGVTQVFHSAGTTECAAAFERLGANPIRRDDVVMSLKLDRVREDIPDEALTGEKPGIRLRLVSPFNPGQREMLDALMRRAGGPTVARPIWWYMVTTLGAWEADRLIGYVQFSIGPTITYEYGLRLDPAYRGHGLGRRLFAGWLRMAEEVGAGVAVSAAAPGNKPMERLLVSAGFTPQGMAPAEPEPIMLYAGEQATFQWARSQPQEEHEPWHC